MTYYNKNNKTENYVSLQSYTLGSKCSKYPSNFDKVDCWYPGGSDKYESLTFSSNIMDFPYLPQEKITDSKCVCKNSKVFQSVPGIVRQA